MNALTSSVAVVGLGHMGLPIASNVAAAGFDTTGWNRSRIDSAVDFKIASTLAEAVADVDVVVSVLATSAALESVFFDDGSVLPAMKPGSIVIDSSTASPNDAREFAERFDRSGIRYIDAPMSGSTLAAATAQLVFMVGGDRDVVDEASPLLEVIGSRVVHVGAVGTGMATKLVVNSVVHSLNAALAEAIELASCAGLDLSTTYDVLEAGAVAAPLVKYKRSQFVDNDPTVAFSIDLMAKDLRLISDLADQVATSMPVSGQVSTLTTRAQRHGDGRLDMSSVRAHLTA